MSALINKARKPKFELHLTIYDLNNVPLVQGASTVKWYLPHSIHAEHRGRTAKSPIDKVNHRVAYNYSKVVPLRISIDRSNNLSECPVEFEVTQEFPMTAGGRDERMTLGVVRLNLSEYVEESENFPRRSMGVSRTGVTLENTRERIHNGGHSASHRKHDSKASIGTGGSSAVPQDESKDTVDDEAEEGIVRRYLMQDSKINSTLKIGILMVQIDGERNYVAPPLKTAPMFGGIAGIMPGESQFVEPSSASIASSGNNAAEATSTLQSRDASEMQDMYRHTLAASWSCQPGELPADQCIEDIFSGGDGWKETPSSSALSRHPQYAYMQDEESNSGSGSPDEATNTTLRPGDIHRMQRHMRNKSGDSVMSTSTIGPRATPVLSQGGWGHSQGNGGHNRRRSLGGAAGGGGKANHNTPSINYPPSLSREDSSTTSDHDSEGSNSGGADRFLPKSDSLLSLTPTLGSTRSDSGRRGSLGHTGRGAGGHSHPASYSSGRAYRRGAEVDERELRDDLVAWKLPGTVS